MQFEFSTYGTSLKRLGLLQSFNPDGVILKDNKLTKFLKLRKFSLSRLTPAGI
ncbi:MAG: hypothetical protein AAGC65_11270 [Mucilaginibacter sp.]|uniref:hypothetical protein n=1 Tax=Mucilaginibacter sp. TaxID=1882438 RepID=UPI0031A1A2CB